MKISLLNLTRDQMIKASNQWKLAKKKIKINKTKTMDLKIRIKRTKLS